MQIEKGFTDNWLPPTGVQENPMRQYAGCKWFVWNRALSIEQVNMALRKLIHVTKVKKIS
jgi:hypothetical protein